MAKHDQMWRDTRWKQKEREKTAEKKRRVWEGKEWERRREELCKALMKTADWLKMMDGDFSFLKEIGPGIRFSEILEGTPYRFISQKWNGDGTYDVRFEMDALSNDSKHEKVGTLTVTALRVSYIAGRLEVHGRILMGDEHES